MDVLFTVQNKKQKKGHPNMIRNTSIGGHIGQAQNLLKSGIQAKHFTDILYQPSLEQMHIECAKIYRKDTKNASLIYIKQN